MVMANDLFLFRAGQDSQRLGLQVGAESYALTENIPSLAWLLRNVPADEMAQMLLANQGERLTAEPGTWGPPVDSQEIWAAGVTYKRSEEARERESQNSTIYSRVYSAQRPEL